VRWQGRTPSNTSSTRRRKAKGERRKAPLGLPAALARRLELPKDVAERRGLALYLVGGAVRDLLLGTPVRDLDFAVEGDAVSLAGDVAEELGVEARVHGRFATATVASGEERLDFAATRSETYQRPGALPRVKPASIDEDLGRRDFSVHAMALSLSPARGRRLLDPFGGREDLARGRLRILHPRSFEDDPTRAYRAARYANRLRFTVEPQTRRAARAAAAAGFFEAISGDRRRRELRLIFAEPRPGAAVRQMDRLGLLPTLHPSLPASAPVLARLTSAGRLAARAGTTSWILYLLVWSAALTAGDLEALSDRLALAGEEKRILTSWRETLRRLSASGRPPRPSQIAALRLTADETAAAAVCSARKYVRALLRLALLREPVKLSIGGGDLVRSGVSPGPEVGRALARTLAARRDGKIPREEELDYALNAAGRPEAS
jgi:tRNA nucleotidyltransferase (CCA-adding enzyme)